MNDAKFNFGAETRDQIYSFDKDTYLTNHGSFGALPKSIQVKRQYLQSEMDKIPDLWFRKTSFDLWNKNRQALANYLNINEQNLVFVENATDGINSILKSVCENLTSNDVILAQEYTYSAILNAIDYVSKYRLDSINKINVFKVPCKFPIKSINDVFDNYEKLCEEIINVKQLKLRVVVIDHISSATAILFPINEIIGIIRKWEKIQDEKIKIVIDGAHAIGQVKINLNKIDCDYYVSNLHKWFLAPRGCAFLYFRDLNDTKLLSPNIISHGYDREATYNYFERGTRDSTSWFVVDECINVYENEFGGINRIEEYTSKLLDEAVELLVNGWGTHRLDIPKELEAPFMKIIKLPYLRLPFLEDIEKSKYLSTLVNYIQEKFNLDSQIFFVQKELYCRISAFVYNTTNDYTYLRDVINSLKET